MRIFPVLLLALMTGLAAPTARAQDTAVPAAAIDAETATAPGDVLPTPSYIIPTRRIGATTDGEEAGSPNKRRWSRPDRLPRATAANPAAPDNGAPQPDEQMVMETE